VNDEERLCDLNQLLSHLSMIVFSRETVDIKNKWNETSKGIQTDSYV
jgi:hypothetical protein